ncbi:uncharacterized protein SPSK_10810 [Sporothrix schenckii 1099-18]|uniref:Uncharacterized protein n=1 Tax=Sporothrix schenckii 1099-18 TaxID=1397361 RepID=A0A0F2MF43_SPOSC|nr:uncharacterized protein SPSK_10810 [Sporothrix schenckii 1099-18]KJR88318.1 hypothetical protein SPSK_10810 [Sporothrix schenckii 1099-18]
MLFINILGWAAVSVLAGPVADRHSSPRNDVAKNRHNPGQEARAAPSQTSSQPSPRPSSLAAPTPSSVSSTSHDSNCTSTMYLNLFTYPFNPSTRTVHLTTVTSTYSVDCHGCRYLETVNIGGLGPVLQGSGNTTTDAVPATVTAFACSA